jgi:hypothetical protein
MATAAKFVQPIPIFFISLVPLDVDVVPIKFHSSMWMQVSKLPTNSSLQNTPRYQCSLKSETIGNLVGSHFENGGLVKMTLNANFIITNQFLTSKYF